MDLSVSRRRGRLIGCHVLSNPTSRNVLAAAPRLALPLIAALLVCGAVWGCGEDPRQAVPTSYSARLSSSASAPSAQGGPFRFFSPDSIWNRSVPVHTRIAPHSAELVSALGAEVAEEEQAGTGPGINTTVYSVPIYTVGADQPPVTVTLDSGSAAPSLQAAWDAVPLPPNAEPAAGSDHVLVVWQPSTGRLWEFWRLEHGPDGWQASWGGAMQNALTDPGVYGPEAWPDAKPWWGSSASSLSIAGGLITLEDLEAGEINHALALGIPNVRAGVYASPAQRTDGKSTAPGALPEGAHLRLDPHLNLAALHLPRLTLLIAEAAQRYGIVVRDTAARVTFYAQDPTPTGMDPFAGPHGYFEGQSSGQLLASFPWSHLQALRMSLHRRRPTTRSARL